VASCLSGADGAAGVKNFSYNLFIEMVRLGYFLVILDGFDEMRHAMDFEDFEYTFDEISALFVGNSKTIILGRPDSFFTDEEEDRVVKNVIGSKTRYSKIEMAMLSEEQVSGYIDGHIQKRACEKEVFDGLIELKSRVIENEFDVLSRPVQLKMFTTVMDKMIGKDFIFNRYELYFNFIYNFSRREDQKSSRKFFKAGDWKYGYSDARTVFMQEIAWWILTIKKENRFFPKEIPYEYIPKELRDRVDRDAALREMIVGSVIEPERKAKDSAIQLKGLRNYYFPHKSYIEFLVSEYFCRADFSKEMYSTFFGVANGEILSFVEEGPADATGNFRRGLEHARGVIPSRILEIAARDPTILDEKHQMMQGKGGGGRLYTFYHWLLAEKSPAEEVETFLFSALINASSATRCSAVYAMLFDYLGRFHSPDLCKRVLVYLFERIGVFNFRKLFTSREPVVVYSADVPAMHMSLFADAIDYGKGRIKLNIKRAKDFSKNMCRSQLYVGSFDALPIEECRVYSFDGAILAPLAKDVRSVLLEKLEGDIVRAQVDIKGFHDKLEYRN